MAEDGKVELEAEAARAAVQAVQKALEPLDTVTLSTGVVLSVSQVSPLLIRTASLQLKRPQVPILFDEEKQRDIENPNDPDYLVAVAEYAELQSMAGINAVILCGTKIKYVPPTIPPLEDTEWVEKLAFLGFPRPDSDLARYLAWIKYQAIGSGDDLTTLSRAIVRIGGVAEEDVVNAMESFRPGEGRVVGDGVASAEGA